MRSIEDFFTRVADSEVTSLGLDGIVSISSGPDNGANAMMAIYFKADFRHATTQVLIDNFLKRLNGPEKRLVMCGHGSPGSVETGRGQRIDYSDRNQSISSGNFNYQTIAKLYGKEVKSLTIYSCSTGADEDGARLLWLFAKYIDCEAASARTGISTMHRKGNRYWMTFENGSTWQTASSSMRHPPPGIPAPDSHTIYQQQREYFEVQDGNAVVKIYFGQIGQISIKKLDDGNLVLIAPAENNAFLTDLFRSDQFLYDGLTLGTPTHLLSLITPLNNITITVFAKRFGVIENYQTAFFFNSQLLVD